MQSHLLDHCRDLPVRTFEAGDPIIEENHKDGHLFILRSGSVEIRKRDVEVNRLSSAGSIFGEVGLLLDQPHGASVVARMTTECYEIEDGETYLSSHPRMALLIAKVLARRLRNVTDELVEVREMIDADEETSGRFGGIMKTLVDHHFDREY